MPDPSLAMVTPAGYASPPGLLSAAGLGPAALSAWCPEDWPVAADWQPVLAAFLASQRGLELARFVRQRLAAAAVVYPPQPLRALELTALADVRMVILGQDPYHGPGQAEGLAFSVAPGMPLPPSLRNIFKELARDLGLSLPPDGSLVRWARQGVLLLNTCLTVEQGQAASHAGQGWEALSDALLVAVAARAPACAYLLWGRYAQVKADLIRQTAAAHGPCGEAGALILCANHPSPLSALRPPLPFIGCGHFSQARDWLAARVGGLQF